jgi:hypothetical protein
MLASAVQIGYILALPSLHDLNSIWRIVVCGQVVQVTSILASTIPFLKPFMMSLDSGLLSARHVGMVGASGCASSKGTSDRLSYLRIGDGQGRNPSMISDAEHSIWVRKEVTVKRDPSIELEHVARVKFARTHST